MLIKMTVLNLNLVPLWRQILFGSNAAQNLKIGNSTQCVLFIGGLKEIHNFWGDVLL